MKKRPVRKIKEIKDTKKVIPFTKIVFAFIHFAINKNNKNATKSNITTTFVIKAIDSKNPAKIIGPLFFVETDETTKYAERIIGNNMKFSAFAIFPSMRGVPKRKA